MRSERLRSALINLRVAAGKVPIIRRPGNDSPPFSVCIGCGAEDSDDCMSGCWVNLLEAAIGDADDAINEVKQGKGGEHG